MKYISCALIFAGFWICSASVFAWDGFDAESIELVEIGTEGIPASGETIEIRNQESGVTKTAIVQSMKQNQRTVEIVVRYPDNTVHTLVMEGR